jgi:hypothetical protein
MLVTIVPPVGADDMLLVPWPAPAGSRIILATELISRAGAGVECALPSS